jgi:hypothetical protein
MTAIAGASRLTKRDSYRIVDLATDISAQARRSDRPRWFAYATWHRRTGALTIFYGDFLHHLDFEIAFRQLPFQPRVLDLNLQ